MNCVLNAGWTWTCTVQKAKCLNDEYQEQNAVEQLDKIEESGEDYEGLD